MGRGQEEAVLVSIEQRRKPEEMTKRSLKELLLAPEARHAPTGNTHV